MTSVLATTATRQVHWDVAPGLVLFMYASMSLALLVFAYGVWRRMRIWRLGRGAVRYDRIGARLRRMGKAIAHATLFRKPLPGFMHALIFFGFLVLTAATVVVFINSDLRIKIMHGTFYLVFQSLIVDLFGLLVLIGVAIAVYRRYVMRPATLEHREPVDGILLAALFMIALTGFGLEGIRLAATHVPWAGWSPIGLAFSHAIRLAGNRTELKDAYPWLWGTHVLMWHTLLASIPFTKFFHVFTSPLNAFFSNLGPARSVVDPTDFQAEPLRLGIRTPADMTWAQLFMLDACTECGRCEAVCPAFAAGKPLSPKRVILDLRDAVRATGPDAGPLAGGVVKPEALWACTTCRACEEACPVSIEHVPLIIGLRQNLAMEQASVPAGVAEMVTGLEARGHPFRGTSSDRTDWLAGLSVPRLDSMENTDDFEIVYWVGCAAAFDERAQDIARAVVRILQHAGVRFAVLASKEGCNGDVARRTGNEFHYDMLGRANVETLNSLGATRILTHCPHCLQQLRYEYGAFGRHYEVVHHTEFISTLIEEGRIRLAPGASERVTFHDPCYLGRYNREFDAPRRVLDALRVERLEMARSGPGSFCCGAGGGHAFYDDADEGEKINAIRASEAAATGATTVVTGCPFCLAMLTSGMRSVATDDRALQTRDVVELVAEALAE